MKKRTLSVAFAAGGSIFGKCGKDYRKDNIRTLKNRLIRTQRYINRGKCTLIISYFISRRDDLWSKQEMRGIIIATGSNSQAIYAIGSINLIKLSRRDAYGK